MSEKLLSKRVNFPSLQDIVDQILPRFQQKFALDEQQTEEMKNGLFKVLKNLLWELQSVAELGAAKGIAEAFGMVEDLEYYETVKKRNKRQRERNKEWREKMDEEARERKYRLENPTYEDKQAVISQSLSAMFHSKENYNKARNKITELCEKEGSQILASTIKKNFKLPDVWVESFDLDGFIESLQTKKVSEYESDDLDDFFDQSDVIQ